MESELARLLTERGLAQFSDLIVPSLAASNIQGAEQPRPTQLGQRIAHAVYAALDSANSPLASRQST